MHPGFKIDERALEAIVRLLGETETLRLLENPRYWPEPQPSNETSYRQSERLLPLREALLGRLGVLNPAMAIDRFPAGARVILRAAAAVDGPATLKLWLATRDDWRKSGKQALGYGSYTLFDEGRIIPLSGSPAQWEYAIGAGLVEGWASADSEAVWQEIGKAESELHSAVELNAFVRGLPDGSNWSEWAARLLPIPWKNEWMDQVEELHNPMLSLAKRWVQVEPNAALTWLREQQVKWDEQFSAELSEDNYYPVNHGRVPSFPLNATTGHTVFIEGEVYVLADWLKSQPTEALEWINANQVEDEVLADAVEWTYLPSNTKIDLIHRIENSGERGRAAIALALLKAPYSMTDQGQEEKRAEFRSLMAELQSIDGIQEDKKARLTRIAAEGASGAYERE